MWQDNLVSITGNVLFHNLLVAVMEVSSRSRSRDLILWVSVARPDFMGLGLVSVSSVKGLVSVSRFKGLGLARDYSI